MSLCNFNETCSKHKQEGVAINLSKDAQLQDMIQCIQCLTEGASSVPLSSLKNIVQNIVKKSTQMKIEITDIKSSSYETMIDVLLNLKQNFNNSIDRALSVIQDQIYHLQTQKEEFQREQNREEFTLQEMVQKITTQQWSYCYDKKNEDDFSKIQNLQQELQQYKNMNEIQNIFILAEKAKQQIKIKINIYNREKNELNKIDFTDSTTSTPKLNLICQLHNKEIIMLDLKSNIQKERRLCCIDCMPTEYVSLELSQIKWKQYYIKKKDFLQQQILDREQSYEIVKDQIQKIEQSIIELIKDISQQFEQNMKQVKQNILQNIDELEQDWQQLNYEQALDRAELLSKPEDVQIRMIQTEYQEIQDSIIINLQEQIQQLKIYQQNLYDNLRSTLCFSQEISKATSQSDQQNFYPHQYQIIIENKQQSDQLGSTSIEFKSRKSQDFQELNNNLFNQLQIKDEIRQTRSASAQIQRIQREEKIQIQEQHDSEEQDKIHYELINKFEQQKTCYTLSFNIDSSLMVNGAQNDIIVSEFKNGVIQEKYILQGHTSQIISLCFSNLKNEFASGSTDKTIRYWQIDNNDQWICSQILQGHKRQIDCLLIDNKDNSIISCSSDKTIRVWRKNENSYWIQVQVLSNHQAQVRCISFSKSQHQLVSCSEDQSIIIWEIDKFKEWKVKQILKNDDYGYRICFIEDDQIAWQPRNNSRTIFYEWDINLGRYKLSQFYIDLSNSSEGYQNFFPSIYNERRQILINKHGQFIYILQRNSKRQFVVVQTINIEHYCNYGSITRNGEYLVIWDEGSKHFSVRKAIQ